MDDVAQNCPRPALPSLNTQVDRLVELGVQESTGVSEQILRDSAAAWGSDRTDVLLAVHPQLAPASMLAPLLCLAGKPGFVVGDMTDVDEFAPLDIEVPPTPLYLVHDPLRGEEFENWTPEEALPVITARRRSPFLLTEGIHWALQQPGVIERGHCFMTIGSRLKKANGKMDSRTPALWISNGTGRDGRERKGAPKVGWCWWGNRHTWLGIASAQQRSAGQPARERSEGR